MEIVVFPHTHWDREWYRTFQDFRIRLTDVMDAIIEELEHNRLEKFYLDGQTVILEDYLELYPEKEPVIRALIRDRRIFVGPWYVLADEFLVSGESLIRNLFIGINQAKSIGIKDFWGYMPDSFGHNSDIPRILASFGLKNAILWRGAGDKPSEFLWQSVDKSCVTVTYLREGYFILDTEIYQKAYKLKQGSISDKLLVPTGGDHIFSVENTANYPQDIEIYLNNLEKFRDKMPTVTGELRDNSKNPILPGTLSSRLYLKQYNATATWQLSRVLEPLQAFLQVQELARDRRNELKYAWKVLLKNHPHDSICGCSVDEVHEENVSRCKQVCQLANTLVDRCIEAVIQDESPCSITVCNMSNYPYTGIARIKTDIFPRKLLLDIKKAPMAENIQEPSEYLVYVEDIPPFSVRNITPQPCPDPVKITHNTIKNRHISVTVNSDGTIRLNDKFHRLHLLKDRTDAGDTYNYCPIPDEKPLTAQFLGTEIIENNDLASTLRIYYGLNTLITTDITVTSGSKRAEFLTRWENTIEDHTLKIKFFLPQKIYETVSENTFGLIKRHFDPDYRLEHHMPAENGRELRTNTAPMGRFVWTQGLGLLTKGLPEYGVSGNSLFITILRSTGMLSKTCLDTRTFPAGPPLDTPGARCLGLQEVRYALCAVNEPVELFREADEFMGSLLANFGKACPMDFLSIDNPYILVYAVKIPENKDTNGVITRVMNLSDREQTAKFISTIGFQELIETDSLEQPVSQIYNIKTGIVFRPYELKTLCLRK